MRADRLGPVLTAAALAIGMCVLPSARCAADGSRVLRLEECITLGFANDPGLRSDELEAKIGEARLG